jgi:hypothetical protein
LDGLVLPKGLTLNGLVALISTVNRVALVGPVESAISQEAWRWFSPNTQRSRVRSRLEDLEISDSASRGTVGSFIFLWKGWKGGRRCISYFGAIVVIVSLAFGTFTQQLISIVTLPLKDGGPGDLAPGNIPNSHLWYNSTGNAAEGGLSTTLSMKAAVYNGMLEGGIAPLQVSCPTGNCTFPVTPTMAVCGECRDVPYTSCCNSTNCQYTLSTGTAINISNWVSGEVDSGVGFQVVSNSVNPVGTSRLDIATFDVFGAPYGSFASPWPKSNTTSSTCSIWMCVNALSVTTTSNSQIETLNATFSKLASQSTEDNLGGSLFVFGDLPPEMNSLPGVNYYVDYFALTALSDFVTELVNGTVLLEQSSSVPSSDTIEAIWNGTVAGLDIWVKNLALSMTNVVRTSAPATNSLYNGTAYQLGIRVRWEWLLLPATMVLMSLFLLVIVIVETSRSSLGALKSSPLAYLAIDLDGAIKEDIGAMDVASFRSVEKAIGRRRAVLENQSSGRLIFREAAE